MTGGTLLLGASGMLGRAFRAELDRAGVAHEAVGRPGFDLVVPETIARSVTAGVGTVINCAGFTDVSAAETREEEARLVNGVGVGLLAERCAEVGATLVHFGTDYVFDGGATRPYPVDHARAPVNAYGRTKALGEELLERAGGRFLLVRTSWLYAPWGKNFVLTVHARMRRGEALKVVDDQRGRPTSAEYLARRTLALLDAGATGTFHACDGGECSWFELARWIAGRTGSTSPVQACRSAEVAGPVRPAYSVLDLEKTETLLGPSTPWQDNVARVLDRL